MRFSDDNPNPERRYEFWRTQEISLICTNPHASDSMMMVQALLRPSFHRLLRIAVEFGLQRLKAEWSELQRDYFAVGDVDEVRQLMRAEESVNRCFRIFEIRSREHETAETR